MRISRHLGALLSLLSLTVALSACSDEADSPEIVPGSSTTTATSGESTSSSTSSATDATDEPETEAAAARRPVSCKPGLGPIVTQWSDGSVGGWSQMCQDQHDRTLQAEIDANANNGRLATTKRRSPASSAPAYAPPAPAYTPPEPDYPPAKPSHDAPAPDNSPWVQGQIDWQNCLDSGNTEEQCRAALN